MDVELNFKKVGSGLATAKSDKFEKIDQVVLFHKHLPVAMYEAGTLEDPVRPGTNVDETKHTKEKLKIAIDTAKADWINDELLAKARIRVTEKMMRRLRVEADKYGGSLDPYIEKGKKKKKADPVEQCDYCAEPLDDQGLCMNAECEINIPESDLS